MRSCRVHSAETIGKYIVSQGPTVSMDGSMTCAKIDPWERFPWYFIKKKNLNNKNQEKDTNLAIK